MRFLFTCVGGPGHLNPLLPISRAVADAGHTVLWATSDALRGLVERAGFPFHRLGAVAGTTTSRERTPLVAPDREVSDSEVRENFARRGTRARLPLVQPLVDDWRPDVVVCDEFDFASVIAAERRGIPHATVLVTAAGTQLRPEVVAGPLGEIRAELGLPADPDLLAPARYLRLSPFPPSFRAPDSRLHNTDHDIRPPIPDAVPRAARPSVYFTLGTEFGPESGDLVERVLAGVRDLPVDVLATVGRHLDPAGFGPQPAHVRIERYVAQDEVLSRCAAVVSHGGSGTVLGALAHGLPHLVLPLGADQPANAERCAELGAGLTLDAATATPDDVRTAVARLLAEPAFRRAAERLRAELAALPGPEHAAALLDRLGRTGRPDYAWVAVSCPDEDDPAPPASWHARRRREPGSPCRCAPGG
ncbi:glycosyltransferase [Actinosynnema sp. NPDC023587]|uniref:glycosyltransferase n=1 Tax=Actinosynnema sp. NPDC023587 TaxID=3154695 RepID=UPI0033D6E700